MVNPSHSAVLNALYSELRTLLESQITTFVLFMPTLFIASIFVSLAKKLYTYITIDTVIDSSKKVFVRVSQNVKNGRFCFFDYQMNYYKV